MLGFWITGYVFVAGYITGCALREHGMIGKKTKTDFTQNDVVILLSMLAISIFLWPAVIGFALSNITVNTSITFGDSSKDGGG